MKVYLQPPQPSRGLQRIADALVRYKPEWVEVVATQAEADLVVVYAIGRRDGLLKEISNYIRANKKYAVIQVCLRSTMTPKTGDWFDIWYRAKAVWSYYDLNRLVYEDGGGWQLYSDHFYHAPLGADAGVFQIHPKWKERNYVVLSSGLSRLSESVRECHLAAQEVGRQSAHLGSLSLPKVDCYSGVPDYVLRGLYNSCEFVSGLRRKEGFELPAIEGLLCGSRPIVFNTEDYKWCYGNHAIYIEETDRQGVIDQLVQIFRHGAPPVTPEERELAVKRYNWETIVGGFYERLRD